MGPFSWASAKRLSSIDTEKVELPTTVALFEPTRKENPRRSIWSAHEADVPSMVRASACTQMRHPVRAPGDRED